MTQTETTQGSVIERLKAELGRVIVGQSALIEEVLLALVAGGHVLLEGVPGLGKTVLVKTLGDCSGLSFARIQFTPDLMPSDITGSTVLEETPEGREFRFRPGPVFTNLLLADEINRATPKTQSALLEAMQETQVTVGGTTHALPHPFLVLATQNPIEMEGTYPLPEAQTDRFLMKLSVIRPPIPDLAEILKRTTGSQAAAANPVTSPEEILDLQACARDVLVAQPLFEYVARLIAATHPDEESCPENCRKKIEFGASPRGGQALVRLARAKALTAGRQHVALEDLQALAPPVLRHRIHLSFEAQTNGVTADEIVDELLREVVFHETL